MNIIHDWWPHITAAITLITGIITAWINRFKIIEVLRVFFKLLIPDYTKTLEAHEKHDDERFDENKAQIKELKSDMKDSEVRIIEAVKENIGYLREDVNNNKMASENRALMLEKVFLDSRLQ